jgi:hypothetical protein
LAECLSPQAPAQCAAQDSRFVALKNAFRIRSGVAWGQAKGTPSTPSVSDASVIPGAQAQPLTSASRGYANGATLAPYVGAAPMAPNNRARPLTSTYSWPSCTSCDELSISTLVQHVWEPGGGSAPNFGPSTSSNDDNGQPYSDWNMVDLCGPGAADVALWFWPLPNNAMNVSATDTYISRPTGYWMGVDPYDNTSRMRGYMIQLAWNIHAPSYTYPGYFNGMMRNSWATPDWVMLDGMKWEASGENSSTWQNYFYVLASPGTKSTFHSNVQSDISTDHVPVVVLLNNANALPNWNPNGGPIGHYITIVGYNDSTGDGGEYAYMDTCGQSSSCNSYGGNSDGGVKVATATQVWNAINGGEWIW